LDSKPIQIPELQIEFSILASKGGQQLMRADTHINWIARRLENYSM
jgi:hypothetical protein